MKSNASILVAQREDAFLEPCDRRGADPRNGTHGVDGPVNELLGRSRGNFDLEITRARAERGYVRVVVAARFDRGEIERRAFDAFVALGIDLQRAAFERQADATRGRVERGVDATNAGAVARLL